MTTNDQMIPADKVREARDLHRDAAKMVTITDAEREIHQHVADAMDALLPAPPLPTLADMTREERHACRWMQADVDGLTRRWLILNPYDEDGDVEVVLESGRKEYFSPGRVTPHPDLPRLEWPGTEKPVPALPEGWRLADHEKHGRVIVTNTTPDRAGNVCFAIPSVGGDALGFEWHTCGPAELTYLDQEAGTTTGPDRPAVGTAIESADDPRLAALPVGSILLDRDEEATTKRREVWTGAGYTPVHGSGTKWGPWTVRRIGLGADQ